VSGVVGAAAEALAEALRTVEGLRVHTDPGALLDPPAAVVGPPALAWEGYDAAPTSARFVVVVVVAMDERALPRLWDLVPLVAAAVDTVPDAVLRTADPGVWSANGADLPSYELLIEVALT
jgi:hypothetical protein